MKGKVAQAFVYFMDVRFKGSWAKKNDEAKFWGFLMAGTTYFGGASISQVGVLVRG